MSVAVRGIRGHRRVPGSNVFSTIKPKTQNPRQQRAIHRDFGFGSGSADRDGVAYNAGSDVSD